MIWSSLSFLECHADSNAKKYFSGYCLKTQGKSNFINCMRVVPLKPQNPYSSLKGHFGQKKAQFLGIFLKM